MLFLAGYRPEADVCVSFSCSYVLFSKAVRNIATKYLFCKGLQQITNESSFTQTMYWYSITAEKCSHNLSYMPLTIRYQE